jgi:hypothetical protein
MCNWCCSNCCARRPPAPRSSARRQSQRDCLVDMRGAAEQFDAASPQCLCPGGIGGQCVDSMDQFATGLGSVPTCVNADLFGQARDAQARQVAGDAHGMQCAQQFQGSMLGTMGQRDACHGAISQQQGLRTPLCSSTSSRASKAPDRCAVALRSGSQQRGHHEVGARCPRSPTPVSVAQERPARAPALPQVAEAQQQFPPAGGSRTAGSRPLCGPCCCLNRREPLQQGEQGAAIDASAEASARRTPHQVQRGEAIRRP